MNEFAKTGVALVAAVAVTALAVSMKPGATAFTVIPRGASSRASESVKPTLSLIHISEPTRPY